MTMAFLTFTRSMRGGARHLELRRSGFWKDRFRCEHRGLCWNGLRYIAQNFWTAGVRFAQAACLCLFRRLIDG
jgi:hypothetical protein